MEPVTVVAAAGLVMRYLLPAIRSLGETVLEKSEDAVGDATVGFGRRLLHTMLERQARADQAGPEAVVLAAGVARRVRAVAADPAATDAVAKLEGAIEELLAADPGLLTAVGSLLGRAPEGTAPLSPVQQGDRSIYVNGNNQGPNITGDSNVVGRWVP